MIQDINMRVSPRVAGEQKLLSETIARQLRLSPSDINSWRITRRSIDARKRNVLVNLSVRVATGDDLEISPDLKPASFKVIKPESPRIVIIGAGPVGLFAALKAVTYGICPVLIERGRDVDSRRLDIAAISREKKINPVSNYCFERVEPEPTAMANSLHAVRREGMWRKFYSFLCNMVHILTFL